MRIKILIFFFLLLGIFYSADKRFQAPDMISFLEENMDPIDEILTADDRIFYYSNSFNFFFVIRFILAPREITFYKLDQILTWEKKSEGGYYLIVIDKRKEYDSEQWEESKSSLEILYETKTPQALVYLARYKG